ncbi:glycosyltransferase family 2 protein [Sphingobacterium sp. Mn56C]|uniref:glycosyltransferase family 2 protein n=1 Tax=Sphingobacterium sp. Mn56C TaxID=3395261 RepID=UPI003BE30F3B
MTVQCSLIISTYNWPAALELCLQSIMKQHVLPNEIIIADDGSTAETQELIASYQQKSLVPLVHVWHEDNGFRLTQIRNKAVAKAQFPYIIQIDGDVMLHPAFIGDHLAIAQTENIVTGSRVNCDKAFSQDILVSGILPSLRAIQFNSTNYFNSLHIPMFSAIFANHYKTKGRHRDFTRGCNMAYWKRDFIAVNGYNEDMTGWGSEDKELFARMIQRGCRKKFLKFAGIVYHIWHYSASKEKEIRNESIYRKTVDLNITFIPNGIDKYLN